MKGFFSWQHHPVNWVNAFFFNLRNKIRWSRSNLVLPQESKDNLYPLLSQEDRKVAETRATELNGRYVLQGLAGASTKQVFCKNLYMLDLLETTWKEAQLPIKSAPKVFDIGCLDWHYVSSLYQFFYHHGQTDPWLTGIELDAYRVYEDFHSRYDYAMAYTKDIPHCQYLVGDALMHKGQYDIVLLLFPFIISKPLLAWGLPLSYLKPFKEKG
jgi:hypothetical protein